MTTLDYLHCHLGVSISRLKKPPNRTHNSRLQNYHPHRALPARYLPATVNFNSYNESHDLPSPELLKVHAISAAARILHASGVVENYSLPQLIYDRLTKTKTYNSEDSLVVTHPTTNSPACGLSTAERTGSPVFHTLWSYVGVSRLNRIVNRLRAIQPGCLAHFSSLAPHLRYASCLPRPLYRLDKLYRH
ncbi:hypothetical protein N7461_007486 [Penicillium sp. DV-2018c]|nr:hypothetical protein N7461_007486 [Penicillium sp. DV-2018c]